MNQQKNYITPEGIKKLRDEYAQLLNVERPKVVEVVAWAAGNGDRSENADYIYGKRRLREIDRRLRFLQGRLEQAHIVDPATIQTETVVFSAKVTVTHENGDVRSYRIVGEDEWDVAAGKISWKSPLARALLGKRVGDEVLIQKPKGEEWVTIEKIEN